MINNGLIFVFILFTSILTNFSFAQEWSFVCNSHTQKQLMGDDGYQTTYCDSNKQYWQLRLKHSSLNWIVFKDGVPVVKQSFKLVSKEVLKDEKGIKNIVEYTIIDESKLKSIFSINFKTSEITWVINEYENQKFNFYFRIFSISSYKEIK